MRLTSGLQKTSFQIKDYTDDSSLQKKVDQKLSIVKEKLKWDEVKEAILSSFGKNPNKKKIDEVKGLLDKFKLQTRTIISEDVDGVTISDAAYYLFQVFYYKYQEMNENYSKNSQENLIYELNKTLIHIFPLCSKNLVEKAYGLIEELLTIIQNKTCLDKLFNNDDLVGNRVQYGANVDYIDPIDIYKNNMKYPFSTDLESTAAEVVVETNNEIKFDFPVTSNEAKADELDQNYLKWVSNVDSDVAKIVYDMLSSAKSNDELQNELLDTLGFEKFDLIGYLLSNRNNVFKSYKRVYIEGGQSKGTTRTYASNAAPVASKTATASNEIVNVLNSEILVHTKAEKQIKKLIRKEEKKLNKFSKSNQGGEFENILSEDLEGLIDTDPNVLRKIREEQLTEAKLLHLYHKNRELLGGAKNQQQPKVHYPYVFDRLLNATQTMAHIAGSKILLPENIQRTDNKQYEQVYIPTANSSDTIQHIDLIDVSTLDNCGKIAFRNVKFLNKIQSVVFQSAYTSNENLLICAPTGK